MNTPITQQEVFDTFLDKINETADEVAPDSFTLNEIDIVDGKPVVVRSRVVNGEDYATWKESLFDDRAVSVDMRKDSATGQVTWANDYDPDECRPVGYTDFNGGRGI